MPLLTKTTPFGSMPVIVRVANGLPVVVTVKLPGIFTSNAALAGLVNAGACVTVRVKICVALGTTPLDAVSVKV